jgi:arsenical pump membrane protein
VNNLEQLDWIAVALLVAGVAAVATGLLPLAQAGDTVRRVLPLLVFLGSVIVLAELTALAEVFDVIAARVAIWGRGNYLALFGMSVVFASATTVFLNLDTTAVLLTPVMLATAAKAGVPGLPLAMLTVWLANTASLLLPVSNLTNLLAADRVDLTPAEFAARMALPQLAAIVATAACLWFFYWRRGRRGSQRYTPPPPHAARDSVLFTVAASGCVVFVLLVLVGIPLAVSSLACTSLVSGVFLLRARKVFGWRMVPFRLLAFVTGLFLVVQTIDRHGLGRLLGGLVGTDSGTVGIGRAGLLGATLSNLLNNLPSYVAGEAAISPANNNQLLGLLIGTNVGPLITPWASLAIILWYDGCRRSGLEVGWRRFAATGAVTAGLTLLVSLAALAVTAGG